ncbi:MAG: asparagine synthase-related protein, partial [Bdellovibrionales bacterium]
ATDRVRGYPLFYNTKNGEIAFDARILSGSLNHETLRSQDALLQFCMAGYVIGAETLHQDIKTLQAGEYIIINKADRDIHVKRYYAYSPCPAVDADYQVRMQDFERALDQAILRAITQADGREVWVPLSGGLDSRLILAKLHEHGCPNLKTFSYGLTGNDEAKIAQSIAKMLDVPWFMMAAKPGKARGLYKSDLRKDYEDFAHGGCVIPSYVEFEAIYRLKESGICASDSFIINGQTGDYLSGGHVPKVIYENNDPAEDDMLDYIIQKHFSIWESLKTPENIQLIKQQIQKCLMVPAAHLDKKNKFMAQYEAFEWAERQAKMVVQGKAIYEYFGFQWALPLWDADLMDFFATLPYALKYKQKLYIDYTAHYNYKGVFDVPRAKVKTFRAPYRYGIVGIGKMLECIKGLDAKDDFYKKMRYYGHFHDQFALFGKAIFNQHYKSMRNIISLSILDFLQSRNIDWPKT